jgi:hypothetical protein
MRNYYADFLQTRKSVNTLSSEVSKVSKVLSVFHTFDTFDTSLTSVNPENYFYKHSQIDRNQNDFE